MFIGIDPSLRALAFAALDEECFLEREAMVSTAPGSFSCASHRLDHIVTEVDDLLKLYPPKLLAIEGFSFASRGSAVVEIHALGMMLRHLLWKRGVPYIDVPPSTLKKFVTGKGNAAKALMLREVYRKWDYLTDDDNEADAYGLARFAERFTNSETKIWKAARKKIQIWR